MNSDAAYTGSLPGKYDSHLGPLFFAPYAADIAARAARLHPRRILEVACGTGIATAALVDQIPEAEICATDLNEAMLSLAAAKRLPPSVNWSVANALSLPFADERFDLVMCQFGVMFFPDRVQAFRETKRVLRAGGTFLFNVWDELESNDVARIVAGTMAAAFPEDPPRFFERTPHGHADPAPIERDLYDAGFRHVTYESVTIESSAPSARAAATGVCEGTPLRNEIIARDPGRLAQVVDAATAALESALGRGAIVGRMRAYVYEAT